MAPRSSVDPPSEGTTVTSSDAGSGSAPRRGSRVKKASSRLQEAASSASLAAEERKRETASPSASTSTKSNGNQKGGKGRTTIKLKNRSNAASKEKGNLEHESSKEAEEEGNENDDGMAQDQTYCICNGGDEPPMIGCEECGNWFHFKCIKLSQKTADQLAEYICPDCQAATGKKSKSTSEVQIEGDSEEEGAPTKQIQDDDSDHLEEGSEEDSSGSEDEDKVQKSGRRGKNKKRKDSDDEDDFEEEEADNKRKRSLKRKSESDLNLEGSASPPKNDSKKKRPNLSSKSKKVSSTSSPSSGLQRKDSSSSSAMTIDPVRSHALSQFETVLLKIFSEKNSLLMEAMSTNTILPESLSGSSLNLLEKTGSVQSEENELEAKQYAKDLEEGLFELYSDKAPSSSVSKSSAQTSSTGKLYKDRFRTFLFGLKDSNNKSLHYRIATGDLLAKDLVKMKGEELANDKIRDEIERKKKESLEMSIRNKELERENNSGMMVNGKKLNHKGEVDLDFEYRKEVETRGRELEETMKKGATEEKEVKESSKQVQNPSSPSTTLNQSSDVIMEESLSAPSQLVGNGGLEPPSNGLLSPTENPFDFNHAWTEDDGPVVEEPSSDGPGMDLDYHHHHHHHEPDFSHEEMSGQEAKEDGNEKNQYDDANDDLIDNFLGGNDAEVEEKKDLNPVKEKGQSGTQTKDQSKPQQQKLKVEPTQSQPPRSTTPIGSPPPFSLFHKVVPLQERPILWSGALTMPDVSTFSGNLHQVAGRILDLSLSIFKSHFFTSEHLVIEGRIPSKAAADYLVQSRLSSRTELVVFAMRPEFNIEQLALAQTSEVSSGPNGIPLTEQSNVKSFGNELDYFHGRERYGVIVPPYERRKEIKQVIKDFYVAPLLKDSPLPEWLRILKPDLFYQNSQSKGNGKGKEREKDNGRTEHLLLLVAVLWKDGLEVELKNSSDKKSSSFGSPSVDSSTPQHHQGESKPESNDPPVPNTSLLQNLLKAVGDGGDSNQGTNPIPGSSSPYSSSGQLTGAAASNLAQLPQSQLENVLTSNPSLVDQLLNSLKTGGALANLNPGSGTAPAPGPPPPLPASFNAPPPSTYTPPIHQSQPPSAYQNQYSSAASPPRWNASPPHSNSWAQPQPQSNSNWSSTPPVQSPYGNQPPPPQNSYGAPTTHSAYNSYGQAPTPAWGAPAPTAPAHNAYQVASPPIHQSSGFQDDRPVNQMEGYSGSGWGGRGRGRGANSSRGNFRGSWESSGPPPPPPPSNSGGYNQSPEGDAWVPDSSNRPRKTGRSARRARGRGF